MNELGFSILLKTYEHLKLCFFALFLAMTIAIPLGIYLARTPFRRIALWIIRFIAILQTIPGIALIALMIVLFVFLRPWIYLPTTGFFPGVLILTLYALLPIVSNTYEGIQQVDESALQVAQGMGMTSRQILFIVELPLVLPLIMTGIRISLVWTISCATLTSLIGAGGLGDLVMQGLRSMQLPLILAGTLPAAFLAILLDWITLKTGKWLEYGG